MLNAKQLVFAGKLKSLTASEARVLAKQAGAKVSVYRPQVVVVGSDAVILTEQQFIDLTKQPPEPLPKREKTKPKKKSKKSQGHEVLGEGAYGRVSTLAGEPGLVVKTLLDLKDPTQNLELECEAMRRASQWMPKCIESSRTRLVMQRLDGPSLTCSELVNDPELQARVLQIANQASCLGIDVSDFHPGNYLWHQADSDQTKKLFRIDASVLVAPLLFAKSELAVAAVYRPLRLAAKNYSFYPSEFETYLFTPVCSDTIPRLWYSQLAAWYEFDPDLTAGLLLTDLVKQAYLKKVTAAYKAANLTPRQAPGSSGLRDKVISGFRTDIAEFKKAFDRNQLLDKAVVEPGFRSALAEFRTRFLTANPNRAQVFGPKSVRDMVERLLARQSDTESTGQLWRREAMKQAKKTWAASDREFALAVLLTFGPGDQEMDELVTKDDIKFELRILLQELSRAVLSPQLMSGKSLDRLDKDFTDAGLPDWRSNIAGYFNRLQELFNACQ